MPTSRVPDDEPHHRHRRALIRALGCAGAAAFLSQVAGCAAPAPARRTFQADGLSDHPLVGKVWAARSARFVPMDTVIEALRRASFALLGEVHDNPDHHAIQAELLLA